MQYTEYLQLFDTILKSDKPQAPYDDAEYLNYTKLNDSRMKRWNKTAVLNDATKEALQSLDKKQHWIIIAEPWCGDASQIVPFF